MSFRTPDEVIAESVKRCADAFERMALALENIASFEKARLWRDSKQWEEEDAS